MSPVCGIFIEKNLHIDEVFIHEESKLEKELGETVITKPVDDGRTLEEAASQAAQGMLFCSSPLSLQQEEAKDVKAFLNIEQDGISCPIAEGVKRLQNDSSVEDSVSKSNISAPKDAKQLEESASLDLKPRRFCLTSHQREELQAAFTKTFYVSADQKETLAADLGLSYKQVTLTLPTISCKHR